MATPLFQRSLLRPLRLSSPCGRAQTASLLTSRPSPLLLRLYNNPRYQTQLRPASTQTTSPTTPQPDLIPPPLEDSGPLLSRLPNRALPSITSSRTLLKTLPIFVVVIVLSSLAIFNYQKQTSSTVASVLYALRTNPTARQVLGDEIYFASKVPWIRGEMNQLHGVIDISFWVKGTKAEGKTRFVSRRKKRNGFFETTEWSLTTEEGEVIQLLEEGERGPVGPGRAVTE